MLYIVASANKKTAAQVDRKSPPRNTVLQLSTHYTDPEISDSPLPKFPNAFKNGVWLYRKSYSTDVLTNE